MPVRVTLSPMTSQRYRFLDCTADAAARELHRDNHLIELSPKVFDCLIYLLEHRERAVGRDELIAAVWGRVDVSDTLLGQTVLKARRAIGDTGHEHTAIRTVPRFGYRWVAETQVEAIAHPPIAVANEPGPLPDGSEQRDGGREAQAADHSPATVSQVPQPPTSKRLIGGLLALAFVAIAVVVATLAIRSREEKKPALPVTAQTPARSAPSARAADARETNSAIAVLPVANSAGDEWFWVRLGLMDQIGRRLQLAGLPVVPSSNIVALTHASSPSETVSDASVRAATGARYVVLPQAIRTATGWRVQLDIHEDHRSNRMVDGVGADVVTAADNASDRLLLAFGKSPPPGQDSATLTTDQLLQRANALLLASDFAGSRRVVETAPPVLRDTAAARFMLARIDARAGALDSARTRLDALRREVSAERDPALRASVLYMLGFVDVREDRSADAEPLFSEALMLHLHDNKPADLGDIYTGLAGAFLNLGRYAQASDALARARMQMDLAGDKLALGRVDANEGILDIAVGRPAEGVPMLRRAAATFRLFGVVNERLLTVAAEIRAHLALLDPAAALAAANAVEPQVAARENSHIRGTFDVQRARALAANGRTTEAIDLLERLQSAVAQGDRSGLPGDIASARARLALESGDAATAQKQARIAVGVLQTVDEQYERARAWRTLTRALQADGHGDEAAAQIGDFSKWAAALQSPPAAMYAALARAEFDRGRHADAAAGKEYAAALEVAEHWGVPADLAEVVVSDGNALIEDGDLDRAGRVVARVARWADQDFACAVLQARLYNALGQKTGAENALARARALAGERPVPALAPAKQ